VLKADGLAAGKGVIICQSEAEAREAADVFFGERRFGDTEVVIEEFLEGKELSLLALCDGENVVPLAPAQDYKRIHDGDEGPNTGGMGSYSPVPGFDHGVNDFKVGDRVAGEAHKGCGYCDNCKKGRYTICLNYGDVSTGHEHYGFIVNGAYGQYQKYSIKSVTKMPDNVTFAEAAMCDTAGVALHGLELSGVTVGGTAAIIGPGPIGLCAMRLAKAMGAARAIMIGRGSRLSASRGLGADDCVDFMQEDPVEAVRRLTGGLGVDQAFECSGAKGTFNQSVRMVRKGGRVVLLGVATDDIMEELPFKYITHNEIAIFGSRANPNTSRKILSMMSAGQLNVKDLITHRFDLDHFSEALDTFVHRKENAIKVVIMPNGEE
jgi:L-iditol 2-dehydrogenase